MDSATANAQAVPNDGHEGEKKDKRTSRACLACRKRKSACYLPTVNGQVTTPCQRCAASDLECVIGGSNRGGRRVRRKTIPHQDTSQLERSSEHDLESSLSQGPSSGGAADVTAQGIDMPSMMDTGPGRESVIPLDPALRPANRVSGLDASRESSTGAGNIAFNDLQNPSDALGILAQIASDDGNASTAASKFYTEANDTYELDYPLVRNGKLSLSKIMHLLQRYKQYYHPYFPLVPHTTLDAVNLARTARQEPHLLTAIMVIASRDMTDEPHLFLACSEHMRALVSSLAAGGPGQTEAVEALLLLAEWTPYTSRSDAGFVGRGEEDREAWMHIGTALRIGYFLGLDRYSFAVRGDDAKDPQWQRKRLVWTACYISDRQISIRLGRAFWSRGPGPLTTLRKDDFPMLAPSVQSGEDFASIFQATLELTLLFSNVHDVLYSNPGNSMRSHLSGGYIKYIDDFRSAIYGWKSVWGTLTCSPNLKAALLMSYDYLRLYTVSFAFHATVKRALPQTQSDHDRQSSNPAPGRVFYNNVGAVGDVRFIYEGLDAAKSLLSMVNDFVDPEKSLRYMPLRFYLYSIYCGVFLYRARAVGVLAAHEEQSVRAMVQGTINRLERAGIGPQHPGSRYSQLLRLLWDKVERKERKQSNNSTATLTNPYRPGSSVTGDPSNGDSPNQGYPAAAGIMGDFSWTDLDAVGNFALGNDPGANVGDAAWWSGFLPADSNNFLFETLPAMDNCDLNLS